MRWRGVRPPVHLNTLAPLHPNAPDGWERSLEFAHERRTQGLSVHPMFATNRQGAHFALANTFLFDEMPSFRDALMLPVRAERLPRPGGARPDARRHRPRRSRSCSSGR